MNDLFPIFVRLRNRRALVVGGGAMATVRVKQLLAAKAAITVIAPEATKEIEKLAAEGLLQLLKREFERTDINPGFFVVIGATNKASVQQALAEEAERHGLLYNVVDQPERCNFYTPAVVERGDLKIAICTQGQSPILSGRLRRELEEAIPASAGEFTGLLGELREKLKRIIPGNLKRQRELLLEFIEKAATK
jgi:precorrin-2 dehydrogenase / sirohydrochlorin ferrochelatase